MAHELVFISHATPDDDFVTRLHNTLEAAGIDTWVDHKNITVGDDWDVRIQTAIHGCTYCIFVLSKKSASNANCKAEWWNFLNPKKRQERQLYVVLKEPLDEEEFPWSLTTKQYVDLSVNFENGLKTLIKAIQDQRGVNENDPSVRVESNTDTSFLNDVPLENLITSVELKRGNQGRLVDDFIKKLWSSARHEKGWVELDRMQNVFGHIALEILRKFESDSLILELEDAIRYGIYKIEGRFLMGLGKNRAVRNLFQLATKLNLIQVKNREITFGGDTHFQETIQFFHPALLAYFAATSLENLSFENMLFKAKYDELWKRVKFHWDNVFIALCGIVDNVNLFIMEIAVFDLILASKCICSGLEIDLSIQHKIRRQLEEQLLSAKNRGDANYILDTARSLAQLGGVSVIYSIMGGYASCPSYWQVDILEIIVGFGKNAIPALLHVLHKPEDFICTVRALGAIRDIRAVKPLQDLVEPSALNKDNFYVQIIINAALAKLGDLKARERLRQEAIKPSYRDYRHDEHLHIWYELADIGIETFSMMMEIMRKIYEKGHFGGPSSIDMCFQKTMTNRFKNSCVPLLLSELDSSENPSIIKNLIIEALGDIRDPSSIGHIAKALHHPEFLIRAAAVKGLSRFNNPESIESLIGALMDSDGYIRGEAVETLGAMKAEEAVPDLIKLLLDTELKHPGRHIHDLALEALLNIGTADALGAAIDWCVQQLPKHKEYVDGTRLSDWAHTKLEIIGTPKAWEALNKWRNKSDTE